MTPNSKPSSGGSAPCRIEWRPSRWLMAALLMLSALAPLAVLASELPRGAAWMLAAAALLHGLSLAWRAWHQPLHSLLFTADGRLLLDGDEVSGIELQWRGPLAFMVLRGPTGRRQRLAWWPDTLPPHRRRELRLATGRLDPARAGPSMAP